MFINDNKYAMVYKNKFKKTLLTLSNNASGMPLYTEGAASLARFLDNDGSELVALLSLVATFSTACLTC